MSAPRPSLSVLIRSNDQRWSWFFLGNKPNAKDRIPVVVDDVLPLAVVIDRPHGAVGELTMPDDRIIFHGC
jgi:hypothetical protein